MPLHDGKKIACFDLSGTLVSHSDRRRPIPFMDALARTMQSQGWGVYIVTSWSEYAAADIVDGAGLDLGCEIRHAGYKAPAVTAILEANPAAERLVFVDDKPRHLKDVAELDDGRVRALGFVGSRKYCPDLAEHCLRHGIELALSAADLATTLMIDLTGVSPGRNWTPEEWATLIPGMDHPFTRSGRLFGQYFDYDRPFDMLRENSDRWWEYVWPQMGWITCRKCLFKTLIETVCAASGKNMQPIWGKPDRFPEYVKRFRHLKANIKSDLEPHFAAGLGELTRGIEDIGAAANHCRPRRGYHWDLPRCFSAGQEDEWGDRASREFHPNRVQWCLSILSEAYGETDWVTRARKETQN